jgi:hypothetical protein
VRGDGVGRQLTGVLHARRWTAAAADVGGGGGAGR